MEWQVKGICVQKGQKVKKITFCKCAESLLYKGGQIESPYIRNPESNNLRGKF